MWANLRDLDYPSIIGSNGCLPTPDLTVRYSWDPSGLLGIEQMINDVEAVQLMTGIGYDTATGMMTSWTTPAGPTADLSWITHRVTPDGTRARPAAMWAENQSQVSIADLGTFTYDGAGSIMAFGPWSYGYDDLGRLASADTGTLGLGSRSYTYDDFGNLTNLGGTALPTSKETNRLTGTGYRYDSLGNLIEIPTTYLSLRHYRFDSRNRMMAAWHDTDLNEYGFVYDAAGERVVRYRIAEGSVQSATFSIRDESGNVLTRVDWVPQQLPSDPDLGYWQAPTHYVYSGRSSILRIEPQITSSIFDADYTTLLRDHLGSMRVELTSDAPVDLVEYWPYGEIASDASGFPSKKL